MVPGKIVHVIQEVLKLRKAHRYNNYEHLTLSSVGGQSSEILVGKMPVVSTHSSVDDHLPSKRELSLLGGNFSGTFVFLFSGLLQGFAKPMRFRVAGIGIHYGNV